MTILNQSNKTRWRTSDPDLLRFLRATEIGEITHYAPAMREAILFCAEEDAKDLHADLVTFKGTSPIAEIAPASLVYATSSTGQLTKILAVFHQAGFDIEKVMTLTFEHKKVQEFRNHLMELRRSNHSRLRAFEMEPDPAALLSRPYWHDFYGMNASRFPGDLSICQRYLQPYFDRRRSPLTILTWVALGGLLGIAAGTLLSIMGEWLASIL